MPVFIWYIQLIGLKNAAKPLNTGTCFSVSSDNKLVLFLFPGIPTGDPAIVAFYDKRIYKKLRLKELSLSDPLYHGKNMGLLWHTAVRLSVRSRLVR
jgi:hypothetical protein